MTLHYTVNFAVKSPILTVEELAACFLLLCTFCFFLLFSDDRKVSTVISVITINSSQLH